LLKSERESSQTGELSELLEVILKIQKSDFLSGRLFKKNILN
jgi:hypothetical protein